MDRPFPAYKGDEPYIFVSYSHKDASEIFPELTWLKGLGFNIWYDEGIEAGNEWREEIANAITNTGLFIYFVTSDSVQSENCRKEVNLADKLHIPIVAIYLEATELSGSLDLTLSDHQAILKYQVPKQEYRRKLQARISSYLDQPIIQPVVVKRKKAVPILAGVISVIILAIGLVFYSQQDVLQTTESTTDDQVDVGAMYSIAVLPFANMSTSEDTGYFADGLSEDILDNLAKTGLKVASRSASFQFDERGQDLSLVGEKLGVAYLLEGSVRQQGDDLRITAQLIRGKDGSHIWSKSYERLFSEGFDVQTSVATNIAFSARNKLDLDVQRNYGWKQNPQFAEFDPQAVQLYFLAQDEYLNLSLGEGGDFAIYVQVMEQAVKADSSFYRPYGHLANTYYTYHLRGRMSLKEARPAAHAAINKALELAPDDELISLWFLGEIRYALDLNYADADVGFRELQSLMPNVGFLNLFLAGIAIREGRASEALGLLANVSEFGVGSIEGALFLGYAGFVRNVAGDLPGALQASTQALKLALAGQDRATVLWFHALNLINSGSVEEAKPFIEEGWSLDRSAMRERYIFLFAASGETEKAKSILEDSRFDLTDHFPLALGYLALGDIDNTFNSIRAGIENHDQNLLPSLLLAEWWDPIRGDPRFDEMLELLDSKVTHTEQYLRDHNITQKDE